jgi:bloom syndrome protein
VLAYFNEHFRREDCMNGCDNCTSTSTFETQDFTEHARNAIRLVRQIARDEVTVLHCVDLYRGVKNKKISKMNHEHIAEYGRGSALARGDVERLFYRLISEDALEQFNKATGYAGFATQYVKLGRNASEFENGRRPLKIQVLASPRNKSKGQASKTKSRKKTQGTGVKAAADDYPASTNVSSPIQPRSRGRLVQRKLLDDSSEDEYVDHVGNHVTEDEDEDEGDLQVSRRRSKGKSKLGAPITADESVDSLNDIHRHILEDFVETAKKQVERIVIGKGLRQKPISDRVLREIAIKFPQNTEELRAIAGLNAEMFKVFGPVLLRLIQAAYNDYEAMMRAQEDRPDDPNHRTVVEISDDEAREDEFPASDMDSDGSETSHYFSVPESVRRFNEQSL